MNAVKRPGSLASSAAFDRLAPGAAVGLRAGRRKTLRQLAFAEAGNDIDGGLRPVCTENSIRVDGVTESPKLAE